MVSDQNDLSRALEHRQQNLGFGGLGGLVDQKIVKVEPAEPGVEGRGTRAADDVRVPDDFLFQLAEFASVPAHFAFGERLGFHFLDDFAEDLVFGLLDLLLYLEVEGVGRVRLVLV